MRSRLHIAVGLPQVGDDVAAVVRAARDAEDAGAWGVWVFDNLQRLRRPELPVLDGWSLLGPLARTTTRVRLASLVTRAGLRPPALVARMAAVVQAASDGRFVLGLGAGDAASRAEERRLGVDAPERSARLAQIEATVREVRAPSLPVRPPVGPPPVWIGGRTQPLADLAARIRAEAWHAWALDPDDFARRRAALPEAVDAWWGGTFDAATAPGRMEQLVRAGATGVTWMLPSARDRSDRPALLDLVRAWAP